MPEGIIRFYEFGEFRLDVRRRILWKNDVQVPLSSRNFDLLFIFITHEGQVLEHEELLDKVWGGVFVEQSNLKKGVSALRQVLGESPNESLFIKTVPRRGYSFVAEVRAAAGEEPEVSAPEPSFTPSEPGPEAGVSLPPTVLQPGAGGVIPGDFRAARGFHPSRPSLNRRGKLILGAAGIVLLALAGVLMWQFSGARTSAEGFRIENLKIQKMTGTGNVPAVALSADGATYAYAVTGENGKSALWAKRIASPNPVQLVPPANEEYSSVTITPDNNAVYYVTENKDGEQDMQAVPIMGGTPRMIVRDVSSPPTFSPDGKRMAYLRDLKDGRRVLMTAAAYDGSDEKEIYSVTDNHRLIIPRWSPDGQKFVFVSSEITADGRIWTISEIAADGSGAPRYVLTPQRGKVHYFDWLRDGRGLVACTEPNDMTQSQLWHVAYPNGEMTRLTNDTNTYYEVNVSADGNSMIALQSERTADLWSLNWSLLQNSVKITDTQNYIGRFTLLPGGKFLAEAFQNGQRGLTVLNEDGSGAQPLFAASNVERTPSASPDGKYIVFISTRSGAQEIWRAEPDGREPAKLTDLKTFLHAPRVSPDGASIYFQFYDGVRWRLMRMPAGGGSPSAVIEETIGDIDFSPDGKMIAYSFFDESKKLWQIGIRNLGDNSLVKVFDISPSHMVLWSRDGKSLLYTTSQASRGDGGSLWIQPLAGGAPKPVIETASEKIFWAQWSPDGQRLLYTRGKTVSNIVLITKSKN